MRTPPRKRKQNYHVNNVIVKQHHKAIASKCIDMKTLLNATSSSDDADHENENINANNIPIPVPGATKHSSNHEMKPLKRRYLCPVQQSSESEMTATTCSTTTAIIDPDVNSTAVSKARKVAIEHDRTHTAEQPEQQQAALQSPDGVHNSTHRPEPIPSRPLSSTAQIRRQQHLPVPTQIKSIANTSATTTTTALTKLRSPVVWEVRYESGFIFNEDLGPVPKATRRLIAHERTFRSVIDHGHRHLGEELNLTWDQIQQSGCMLQQQGGENQGYWEICCVPGRGDRFYSRIYAIAIRASMPAAWIVESIGLDANLTHSNSKVIAVCDTRGKAIAHAKTFACTVLEVDSQGRRPTWDNLLYDGVVSVSRNELQYDHDTEEEEEEEGTDQETLFEWSGGSVVVRNVDEIWRG